MALVLPSLQLELEKIMNPDHPQFIGHPETAADGANNWAEAIGGYAELVTPPSSTGLAAKAAFIAIFATTQDNTGETTLKAALTAYAAALGGGMAPAFTATPPPNPIDLTAWLQIPLEAGQDSLRASTLAGLIDGWFRTGTAIQVSSGATVNWN